MFFVGLTVGHCQTEDYDFASSIGIFYTFFGDILPLSQICYTFAVDSYSFFVI